jgi:hypothetical protein
LGIHNIYNGIEDVMLSLANDVDGYVPTGETAHQDPLDQMSAGIEGKRPFSSTPSSMAFLSS